MSGFYYHTYPVFYSSRSLFPKNFTNLPYTVFESKIYLLLTHWSSKDYENHTMNTICENSDDEAGRESSLVNLGKLSTLEKNNLKWNAIKDDVYRIYIEENSTLEVAMSSIHELHGFSAR